MLSSSQRLSAVLLTLVLAAGQAGLCAGWMSRPEARMACCSNGGSCALRTSESEDGPARALTQAEADGCCAASEQDDPAPAPATVAFVAALASALSPTPALLPEPEPHPCIRRAERPRPSADVPKHVLLSVFLV